MIPFEEVGRLPVSGDNVAIATRTLQAGTTITFEDVSFALSSTILEGHRFAVLPIDKGALLTSWGMAFGTAISDIEPGTYVVNQGVLDALRGRSINFTLPDAPNFTDDIPAFTFDANLLEPSEQVPRASQALFFEGFDRGPRGAGTRNYVAIIGLSSRAAGFARRLAHECQDLVQNLDNVDGVVPIAHTEGDDAIQLNKELLLRTLAGFLVHPNVGAALVIDHPSGSVSNAELLDYMSSNQYPIAAVPYACISLDGAYRSHLKDGRATVQQWVKELAQCKRVAQPLSKLKIALQCGGSDAFSGISGNPLAGWVARAVIEQGGSANLAETDELIGAESYVLKRVQSEEVARRFLHVVDRFQQRAHLHGSSAAGNPSGGNKFRGLYNIYLKSLGAAMKRHPDVRLDEVIEYGEPMRNSGYYFMDSPGNDLESIAGQVAAGCNVIFFVTGNGSITNFPFVPTIKIVTTSERYAQLESDMDVNAGLYLDGTSMDDLGKHLLMQTIDVAGGTASVGEKAGHAQVQLWRNWRLSPDQKIDVDPGEVEYSGIPVLWPNSHAVGEKVEIDTSASKGIGLVLPTSLCSGQISNMAVSRLNASNIKERLGVRAFVSLVHTEGCGASSGASEELFLRTMCGYLTHSDTKHALLLEHGCEKTHNDYFRNFLEAEDIDTTRFGYASIQQDGGIDNVLSNIEAWFEEQQRKTPNNGSHPLTIGFIKAGEVSDNLDEMIMEMASSVIQAGGSFVIPSLYHVPEYKSLYEALGLPDHQQPSINYAQKIHRHGLHLMAAPTAHPQELMAGIGATGAQLLIVAGNGIGAPAHPMVHTLQIADVPGDMVDWNLETGATMAALWQVAHQTIRGEYEPLNQQVAHTDFQISRGWRGISL